MLLGPWARLATPRQPPPRRNEWLASVLAQNASCDYLRRHGSPRTVEAFRAQVPHANHEELKPWIEEIENGKADVLFAGRPIAFERTAGSSGASKLIPYSHDGIADFSRSIVPWLHGLVRHYGIEGRAYFSISPVTRAAERIGDVPVGMPDGAYLGETASAVLSEVSAVPLEVGAIADVDAWRRRTLQCLAAARDLELVSVWSPTFLLRLLDDLPDPRALWPRLKVVSCWASGPSEPFARDLAARLPHAHLQPKGLVSTEAVVTVPDALDRPVLTPHGFFEFRRGAGVYLPEELESGAIYEVLVTTASGLYRYGTGDMVRCDGATGDRMPILEFIGRGDLVCDLVGEKLAERFVARCLASIGGFRLLVPDTNADGYVLLVESTQPVDPHAIDRLLCENPQYGYARRLGQLRPLRLCRVPRLFDRYASVEVRKGARLGDVKPVALRRERSWIQSLEAGE